jgi:hypothetical protein
MSNIKTITEMLWSGSNDATFQAASGSLTQEGENQTDYIPTIQLLQKKIDELIEEVNILKNQ